MTVKLIPINTAVYLKFSPTSHTHGADSFFYIKGVVVKHLKTSMVIDIGAITITLKSSAYLSHNNIYINTKKCAIKVADDMVEVPSSTSFQVLPQNPELDDVLGKYFVDINTTYPNLIEGQSVIVNGKLGTVVFEKTGNLGKVPRFLSNSHGRYYANELSPITEFSLPAPTE